MGIEGYRLSPPGQVLPDALLPIKFCVASGWSGANDLDVLHGCGNGGCEIEGVRGKF